VPKSLSAIVKGAFGSMVSLVDCIVVKKYPMTFSEFRNGKTANDKAKVVTRSVQTAEYIQGKYCGQLESSYRLNFKLKVVDALKTYASAFVSV
jgi:hypothetical protein